MAAPVSALRRVVRGAVAHARAPAVAAASQFLGLVQIYLLTRQHGAGTASDAYFFLFSMSLLPTQVLLVGVAYPILLNSGSGAERRSVSQLQRLVPAVCVGSVAVGTAWLFHVHRLTDAIGVLVAACAANGFISAINWHRALRIAADGNAMWLAGVALPANAVACLAIIDPWNSASTRATAMVLGLLVGNLILCGAFVRANAPVPTATADVAIATGLVPRTLTPDRRGVELTARRRDDLWYLAKSVLGYAGGNVIQALALLLPAASVTILNVVMRLVGVLPTTVVSTLLPRVVNRASDAPDAALRLGRWIAYGMYPILLACLALTSAKLVPDGPEVLVVSAWLIPASLNAIAHRVAYRFLAPAASVWSVVTTVLILTFLSLAAGASWFSLNVVLLSCMALDAVPGACILWTLKQRDLSVLCAAALAIACAAFATHMV